jgi:type II secretory pathway component PulF
LEAQWHWIQVRFALSRPQTRIEIYERFFTFTSEGKALDTIVRTLLANAEEEKSPWAVFWRDVAHRMINEVQPFSQALGRHLPNVERVMLGVGESSGAWKTAFEEALFVCRANGRIQAELRKQLMYPAILLLALVAMLVVIASDGVAPQLEMMLDRPVEEWPTSSYLLKTIGDGLIARGLYAAIGAVAVLWGILATLSKWVPHTFTRPDETYGRKPLLYALAALGVTGAATWMFGVFGSFVVGGLIVGAMAHPRFRAHVRAGLDQSVPPWSIFREYQAASFLIALAALVRSGRPFDSALRDVARIASPWLRAHLDTMQDRVQASEPPGDALNTGLLSREVSRYIRDFDRMGSFRSSLDAVGVRGVDRAVLRVSTQAGALRFGMVVLVMVTMMLVYAGVTEPGYLLYTESQQGVWLGRSPTGDVCFPQVVT